MRINEENKVWRKYITFSLSFVYKNNEVNFHEINNIENKINNLKIQALSSQGVVLNEKEFIKKTAPNFSRIQRILLIKETVLKVELFDDLKGVEFISLKVEGKFQNRYKLMNLTNAIDCVDRVNSVKKEFDFLSKLVLIKSMIPKEIDGFFLSGWDKYGKYETIVNERLKKKLLQLEKASEFLIFDKIEFSDED